MTRQGRLALTAAAVALILVVLGGLTAFGQATDLQIEEATLQLWPEYDDPGLLIIYSGTLTGTTDFPQRLAIPVPDGARGIQATYEDASGTLINRQFEVKDGRLTYEVPSPNFHLEYYVDRQPGGNQRDIRYALESVYPIRNLVVAVQQPARSTDFSLDPAPERSEPRADNLTYHFVTRTGVGAGEKIDLAVRYNKTDAGLSSPQLTVTENSATSTTGAQESGEGNNWLPWLLIGAGLVALAAIAAYYFLSQRKPATAAPAPAKAATAGAKPAPRPAPGPARASVFCTQCGKPLRPEDRFCAQCGAPRRG